MSVFLYEVLIRGSADGFAGAHAVYAAESVNPLSGESRLEFGPAQPLSGVEELPVLLGDLAASALAQNGQLQADVAALTLQLQEQAQSHAAAEQHAMMAAQQALQAAEQAQELAAELDAARQRIADLESQQPAEPLVE